MHRLKSTCLQDMTMYIPSNISSMIRPILMKLQTKSYRIVTRKPSKNMLNRAIRHQHSSFFTRASSSYSSEANLNINPWTIQLNNNYLSTRVTSSADTHSDKTALILFLDKDSCIDYRQVMINNYERTKGKWSTNFVSYSIYEKNGEIVLDSVRPSNESYFEENENHVNLKCVELDMRDELNIYDLNLFTNLIYFIVTSFDNDLDTNVTTLHGIFSQKTVRDTTTNILPYDYVNSSQENDNKLAHIVNIMNRIYKKK